MVAAPTITPRDRELIAALDEPAGIDPVEFAEWIKRPEIQEAIAARDSLRAREEHAKLTRFRDRVLAEADAALDTLKATLEKNKDLASDQQLVEARRAATSIKRLAQGCLRPIPCFPFGGGSRAVRPVGAPCSSRSSTGSTGHASTLSPGSSPTAHRVARRDELVRGVGLLDLTCGRRQHRPRSAALGAGPWADPQTRESFRRDRGLAPREVVSTSGTRSLRVPCDQGPPPSVQHSGHDQQCKSDHTDGHRRPCARPEGPREHRDREPGSTLGEPQGDRVHGTDHQWAQKFNSSVPVPGAKASGKIAFQLGRNLFASRNRPGAEPRFHARDPPVHPQDGHVRWARDLYA